MIIVQNISNGEIGLFITGGAKMALVSQTSGNIFTVTSGTASKVNVYLNANVVTIQNNIGSSQDFMVTMIRTRNQT